jgi:hypothetical protein
VVRHRSAKPSTAVRIRHRPQPNPGCLATRDFLFPAVQACLGKTGNKKDHAAAGSGMRLKAAPLNRIMKYPATDLILNYITLDYQGFLFLLVAYLVAENLNNLLELKILKK